MAVAAGAQGAAGHGAGGQKPRAEERGAGEGRARGAWSKGEGREGGEGRRRLEGGWKEREEARYHVWG